MAGWQTVRFGTFLLLVGGLTGCGVTSIRSIHEHPQRHWFNSTVELEGKVIDRVPMLDAAVYQLQDQTGEIWILTPNASLKPGEKLLVKGKVRFESIPIAGQELGEAYIEEQKREVAPDDQ